eukprot:TRINITY_DN5285_c0_g1_i3.p1 TRINITY_DN5285_c0_g1~~TRINITY_DN5285_c0_g1_i3.p1  ORF type:complete len:332 (+),score=47.92 TRINITY_DN5285_c0_g1_i3:102-1097(+)
MAAAVRAFFPSIQKKPLQSIGTLPATEGQPNVFGPERLAPLKPLGPVPKSDECVLISALHPHPLRLDMTVSVHGKRCALCAAAGKEFWRCAACDYSLCMTCKAKQPHVIGANFARPLAVGKAAPRPLLPAYPLGQSLSQPPTPPPQLAVDESDPIPIPTDEIVDAPQHWHPLRFTLGLHNNRCDVCHALGTMFLHCAECQYDLCRVCYMRELRRGEPSLLEQVLNGSGPASSSPPPRRPTPRTLHRSASMPAGRRMSSPNAATPARPESQPHMSATSMDSTTFVELPPAAQSAATHTPAIIPKQPAMRPGTQPVGAEWHSRGSPRAVESIS